MSQYIIIQGKFPQQLQEIETGCPVLLHAWDNLPATVFDDRRKAKRAIKRTNDYVQDNNYSWDTDYKIVRLEPAQ